MFQTSNRVLTQERISEYTTYLQEEEKSKATVEKYTHDLAMVEKFFHGAEITKSALIEWKNQLIEKYAAASINTIIAALNSFFRFAEWDELVLRSLKTQKKTFCDESRELTRDEYERLVKAAESTGNRRLALVIQTICATGIRVSELKFITVDAVRTGKATFLNKGKIRTVFLSESLRRGLTEYIKAHQLTSGPVFVTRNGKPLDRSNIWRDMKALCESAGVEPKKVFPHNLRHLFARTYYSIEMDLSRLADILGHTNINTTRIYTMESGAVHAAQVEQLGLFIT